MGLRVVLPQAIGSGSGAQSAWSQQTVTQQEIQKKEKEGNFCSRYVLSQGRGRLSAP